LPATDYGFLNYDDWRVLVEHPELFAQPGLGESLRAIVIENHPREEPLLVRDLSWLLDSRIFGFHNPRGYHTVNVWLHGVAVAMLYLLILVLTRNAVAALLSGLCYLSLAIHVEPVTWVMGRKDLLAACFTFGVLLSQCRCMDSASRVGRAGWYGVTLLLLPLGLLSKISFMAVPGVMLLLGVLLPYVRGDRACPAPMEWKRVGRWLLLVAPHLAVTLAVVRWYKAQVTAFGVLDRFYHATALEHVRNLVLINPWVFLRYLENVFVPRRLALFYAWPSVTVPLTWWFVGGAVVTLLALGLGLLVLLLRRKDLLFFALAFLVLMVPYLNIVYVGIWVANRYLYAAIGFPVALLCVVAAQHVGRPVRWKAAVVVTISVAMFCVGNLAMKLRYQRVWSDSETLWRYELAMPNPRVEPFENLARLYYLQAVQQPPGAAREALLKKSEDVIAGARANFGGGGGMPEPAFMYQLVYVEAIIGIVRGAPFEQRVAALERVTEMNPRFENSFWELMVMHYRRALETSQGEEKKRLARKALEYYRRYAAVRHLDGKFEERRRAMLAGFPRDFPSLASELDAEH